jgi:hypothetical protein
LANLQEKAGDGRENDINYTEKPTGFGMVEEDIEALDYYYYKGGYRCLAGSRWKESV